MGANEQGLSGSENRYHVVLRTLVFITNQNDVLLLKGSPHKRIWPNLYNGIGGHMEQGETVLEAALREIKEETGLDDITALRLRGVINIDSQNPSLGIMVFVFTATSPSREIRPSGEGSPEWIDRDNLPLEQLVEDLPAILPHILEMKADDPPFFARYWYDKTDRLKMDFSFGGIA